MMKANSANSAKTAKDAHLIIMTPIFRYRGIEPAFGISETHFRSHSEVIVYSSYRRKDGTPWNPYIYSVTREVAMGCKSEPCRADASIHLRIVPLSMMRVVGRWTSSKKDQPVQPKLFEED